MNANAGSREAVTPALSDAQRPHGGALAASASTLRRTRSDPAGTDAGRSERRDAVLAVCANQAG